VSTLLDDTNGLDAARALYGGPDSGEADATSADALFEAWARGYRTGLRYGKRGAVDHPPKRPAFDGDAALRDEWLTGFAAGVDAALERAPAVRIYPLVAAVLDTDTAPAGGPQT
jgi:hypothetical protein